MTVKQSGDHALLETLLAKLISKNTRNEFPFYLVNIEPTHTPVARTHQAQMTKQFSVSPKKKRKKSVASMPISGGECLGNEHFFSGAFNRVLKTRHCL